MLTADSTKKKQTWQSFHNGEAHGILTRSVDAMPQKPQAVIRVYAPMTSFCVFSRLHQSKREAD